MPRFCRRSLPLYVLSASRSGCRWHTWPLSFVGIVAARACGPHMVVARDALGWCYLNRHTRQYISRLLTQRVNAQKTYTHTRCTRILRPKTAMPPSGLTICAQDLALFCHPRLIGSACIFFSSGLLITCNGLVLLFCWSPTYRPHWMCIHF